VETGVLGLALTLAASVAWSSFDAVRKGLARHISPAALSVWLPLAQVPLLMLWAGTRDPMTLPAASLAPMAASAVLTLLGLLWFMQALRSSPMSITVPLLSFTPVLAALLAWAFRHQTPTPFQGAGALLVVTGAFVMGMKSSQWPGLRAYGKEPGVRCMLGTAVVWAAAAIFNQVALERGANAWYAAFLSLAVGLLMALALLALRQGVILGRSLRALAGLPGLALPAVLLGGAALALELEALRVAPVGFIEVVKRGLGMSGAILLGRIFFKEPVSLPKLLAVVLMTGGVALVVLGIA
jgi:drug/metabolite transporter (DMT)-like permease